MKLKFLSSLVLASLGFLCATGSAVAQSPYTVVMRGLDNPRGMAMAPNGALYATAAGRGGAGPCGSNGAGESRCYGKTGAITRWWRGQQSRVVEGLDSHALPDGSSAAGPNDISFQGTGGSFVTIGLGGSPELRQTLGGELLGKLIHMAASGQWQVISDVAAHEFASNPAGGPLDSNPFGVLAEPGGRLVADAGANALFSVAANDAVETVAVFPPQANPTGFGPPMIEAVPTSVARAADGTLYVGQLSGFPFVQGLASIFRVLAGQAAMIHCSGFRRSSTSRSQPTAASTWWRTPPAAPSSSHPTAGSCRASRPTARARRSWSDLTGRLRWRWVATVRST